MVVQTCFRSVPLNLIEKTLTLLLLVTSVSSSSNYSYFSGTGCSSYSVCYSCTVTSNYHYSSPCCRASTAVSAPGTGFSINIYILPNFKPNMTENITNYFSDPLCQSSSIHLLQPSASKDLPRLGTLELALHCLPIQGWELRSSSCMQWLR